MFNFFDNIDSVIVDAVFIAVILLITFLGCIKGFKKTFIGTLIFSISLFLAFSPWLKEAKVLLVDEVLSVEKWLPAGSDSITVFIATLLTPCISAIVLFALFYIVLKVLVIAIRVITRAKMRDNLKKSKIGRVFGGLISLVFGGVFFISIIMICNNNLIGMRNMVDDSKVVSFVIEKTEDLLNKKDKNLSSKIVLKIYKGDFLAEVSEDSIKAFNSLDEVVVKFLDNEYKKQLENEELVNEQIKVIIKEQVMTLHELSILSNDFDDFHSKITTMFFKMSEEWIAVINKKADDCNLGGVDIETLEYADIKVGLKDAGLDEKLLKCLDEVVQGK